MAGVSRGGGAGGDGRRPELVETLKSRAGARRRQNRSVSRSRADLEGATCEGSRAAPEGAEGARVLPASDPAQWWLAVGDGGPAGLAGGASPCARAPTKEPFDPLAPAFFGQGGRKACPHPTAQDGGCAGEGAGIAGGVTAPLARPPAVRALAWRPWGGSIIPAWRAEVGQLGFTGAVFALLGLSLQGRADLVLRVEDGGEVVLVLGSERARGLKDPQSAQRWAEGVVVAQLERLEARAGEKPAAGAGNGASGAAAGQVEPGGPHSVQAAAERPALGGAPAGRTARKRRVPGGAPVTLSYIRNKKGYSGKPVDIVDSPESVKASGRGSADASRADAGPSGVDCVDKAAASCEAPGHGRASESGAPQGLQAQLDGQEQAGDQGEGRRGSPAVSAACAGGGLAEGEAQGRRVPPVACGRAAAQSRGGRGRADAAGHGGHDLGSLAQRALPVRVRPQGQELCRGPGSCGGRNGREASLKTPTPTIHDTYCIDLYIIRWNCHGYTFVNNLGTRQVGVIDGNPGNFPSGQSPTT